jgi:hypothetical protein
MVKDGVRKSFARGWWALMVALTITELLFAGATSERLDIGQQRVIYIAVIVGMICTFVHLARRTVVWLVIGLTTLIALPVGYALLA